MDLFNIGSKLILEDLSELNNHLEKLMNHLKKSNVLENSDKIEDKSQLQVNKIRLIGERKCQ